MTTFVDKSTVERVKLDGEIGAVNAARISFDKWTAELNVSDLKLIKYLKDHNHKSPFFHTQIICLFADKEDVNELLLNEYDKDLFAGIEICGEYVRFSMFSYEKLKDKLPKHAIIENPNNEELNELITEYGLKKATTIPYLSFRISCPFFVYMQLDRHRVGLAINMVSRRYVDTPPIFWKPKKWRKQSKDNKQASIENEFVKEKSAKFTDGGLDNFTTSLYSYENAIEIDNRWYQTNIANEMCKEKARAKLPLATFTSFVWTGSLEDFARIYNERVSPLAQIETKEVAIEIGEICEKEYPDAWKSLTSKID